MPAVLLRRLLATMLHVTAATPRIRQRADIAEYDIYFADDAE